MPRRLQSCLATRLATSPGDCELLSEFFLTADGEARKSLLTKSLSDAHPDLDAILRTRKPAASALADERAASCVTATMRRCIAWRAACIRPTPTPKAAAPRSTSMI